MYRKIRPLLIALIGVGLVALGWGLAKGQLFRAAPPASEPQAAKLIFPQGPLDRALWPHDQSRVWSVDMSLAPTKSEWLGLVVRKARAPRQPISAVQSARWRSISHQESEKELLSGRSGLVQPTDTVTVGLQLIDLRDPAIMPWPGKDPLRMLLTLQVRHGTDRIAGPPSVLEGDQFDGTLEGGRTWEGDELHLINVYTKAGDQRVTYDVVLVHKGLNE
jgi:hypothetical protein